jgi:hypothetical protein
VLGDAHPHTLGTHLNLAVTLINCGQHNNSLRELRRIDERLRRFVGAQLTTTLQERVRRRWLVSESAFQDVVFSLALQYPEADALRLTRDVLLRWKRLAGEAEAPTARLARSSRDPRVVKVAEKLSRRRSDSSRLVDLPEPDGDAIAVARAEVDRLEVALARLSREFQGHLADRPVEWKQVQSALHRGSALLSLRAFNPVDFNPRPESPGHRTGSPCWSPRTRATDPRSSSPIWVPSHRPPRPIERFGRPAAVMPPADSTDCSSILWTRN